MSERITEINATFSSVDDFLINFLNETSIDERNLVYAKLTMSGINDITIDDLHTTVKIIMEDSEEIVNGGSNNDKKVFQKIEKYKLILLSVLEIIKCSDDLIKNNELFAEFDGLYNKFQVVLLL